MLPIHDMKVISAIVADALELGYTISVHDGEAFPVKRSRDRVVIIAALGSTDADSLVIRRADGERVGFVYLVYGNSPGEVICDHTDTPEMAALLKRANAIADRIAA